MCRHCSVGSVCSEEHVRGEPCQPAADRRAEGSGGVSYGHGCPEGSRRRGGGGGGREREG